MRKRWKIEAAKTMIQLDLMKEAVPGQKEHRYVAAESSRTRCSLLKNGDFGGMRKQFFAPGNPSLRSRCFRGAGKEASKLL